MLQKSAVTRKKLPPLKSILALPTWGRKCFLSEAEPFEIPDFDLGHPVISDQQRFLMIKNVYNRLKWPYFDIRITLGLYTSLSSQSVQNGFDCTLLLS